MDIAKLTTKQSIFFQRLAAMYSLNEQEVPQFLAARPRQSVRLNRLKTRFSAKEYRLILEAAGVKLTALPWFPEGWVIAAGKERLTQHPALTNGELYIQNASSFVPVVALNPQPREKVLDMCAAPGGKTALIAGLSHNQAELWVNDNSKPRLHRMRENFARLGVQTARETLYGIEQLGRRLSGEQFDKILLDAPCSGEGLIDPTDLATFTYWSVAHIKRLQQLQKKAIMAAWQLLKPGGTLVYSTCTMAPEENEAVIDYLLRRGEDAEPAHIDISLPGNTAPLPSWHGKTFDPRLRHALRLRPTAAFEAFFVAKIVKKGLH